jgi:hypothetical protein
LADALADRFCALAGRLRRYGSEAFELVPNLQIAYVWHASIFTREVLNVSRRYEHGLGPTGRQTSTPASPVEAFIGCGTSY